MEIKENPVGTFSFCMNNRTRWLLNRHQFEEAREMYADLWLGFTELEMERYLKGAGFRNVETAVVYKEQEAPYLETLLATGEK